jgi:nucleoside phosphorylase
MGKLNARDSRPVDAVIITALPKEQSAVLRHLPAHEPIADGDSRYFRASLHSPAINGPIDLVVLCLEGMGNQTSAIATFRAIDVWNPAQILLTGIAGGLRKGTERSLGDVVVGEQIVYYEPAKLTPSKAKSRYEVYRPGHAVIENARRIADGEWRSGVIVPRPDGQSGRARPQVHFGVVASGEKVIASAAFGRELASDWSQLVAVEMEGAGSATAAYRQGFAPGLLVVKGISDWADARKRDDWQEYASDVAATFVVELLGRVTFQRTEPHRPQPQRERGARISGRVKIEVCERLVADWRKLADYFDIPLGDRARFDHGGEPEGVWEWLDQRGKLGGFEEALRYIHRDDLIPLLHG